MIMSAYDKVLAARSTKKLTSMDYINSLFGDTFIELHGDRNYSDDKAVVGGVGMLNEIPVTVIGLEKGRNTFERMERNFGAAHPEGYRKALRLMKQAEKFHRPILCFVDTSGAFCGIGAEERGQGHAIATNMMEMMALKTPILSVFIGEGGSGGAIALAVADEVWMMENAVYSVISPEGCASILWKDSSKAAEAAECLKMTSNDLFELGVIERILREPTAGDQKMFESLKLLICRTFEKNLAVPVDELTRQRYNRFRKFGAQD
jgi:acetyl-CoA carboxylase carboxyl transferase subunit alpha